MQAMYDTYFTIAGNSTPASSLITVAGELSATTLDIGGTNISASADELNLLDNVSGLVQADLTKLAAVDATAAEINAAADIDTRVENVTSTNSITAAETGKTFFLNSGTEFESTLPAPAAGLEYTFIVKAAPSGASYEIKTNGDTDILIGLVSCATAADLGATDDNADVIRFVGGSAVVGDWVRVVSDGTSWYFSGACKVAAAITTATS
jgi:hypothetical protein